MRRIGRIIALLLAVSSLARADDFPIGPAWAATAINAAIFRCAAVASSGPYQFAAYYNPDSQIVVAKRQIGSAAWELVTLETKGNVHDAHNVVVLGVSSDGMIHLSYDQHGQPLHYRVTRTPFDIHSFGPEEAQTGDTESTVTYPQFVSAPGGDFYFFYRDGASGNGSLCLNLYDPPTRKWLPLHHPLIDGENRCNPYWWRPAIAPDGSIHLAWCWRDSPDASSNHDICYAVSRDHGRTWQRSDGSAQKLPITPENAEVIWAIPKNSNLINQCSSAVDPQGRPHFAQYLNDANGIPQYFHLWFDGATWQKSQVSNRRQKFSIGGGGSLAIPISRPEIAISTRGIANIITRDAEYGGGIRIYSAAAPWQEWNATDLTTSDLGNWEPSYDLARWRDSGILSLFVLPVRQGNHEKTTDFAPQTATIMETALPGK